MLHYKTHITCIHTYVRTHVRTYIHTYMRTYMHTYMHTYITVLYIVMVHCTTLQYFTLHYNTLHYIPYHIPYIHDIHAAIQFPHFCFLLVDHWPFLLVKSHLFIESKLATPLVVWLIHTKKRTKTCGTLGLRF